MAYSTVFPLTLPSLTSDRCQHLLEEQPLLSLYELFATIPDPRSRHGLRYELPFLLTCLIAGLLCNCDSTLAVAQWCRDQRLLLIRLFGPRCFLCPSDSLYRKLLPRLDAEHIEWTLADWLRRTLKAQPDDPIALDGKTVRGAGTAEHAAPICSPSARIRARKPCCKWSFPKRPTKSLSPRHSCLACLSRDASSLLMRSTPKKISCYASLRWEEKLCSRSKTTTPPCMWI